ncbi:MAG: hypothetical protein ABI670_20880 [Chloroflexota bacterium]
MDIRDRVMGDMPDSFFHKIAGIIPGFTGYMDRERRRDSDKVLRTYLAHQYSAQRDRLNRVQQGMMRAHQLDSIAEVDRNAGVLQRFIDRLNTATYGYSGMFDPVKVEAQDLDQLYTFDMALTSGVDDVSTAISAVESAITSETAKTDVSAALTKLSSTLDELNLRLNQRGDLLTTGRGLPPAEYTSLVDGLSGLTGAANAAAGGSTSAPTTTPPTAAPGTGAPPQYSTGTPYPGGAPTVSTATEPGAPTGGETARYSGPTTQSPELPPYPTTGAETGTATTDLRGTTPQQGADTGIMTGSSPAAGPLDHGSDIAGDLPMAEATEDSTGLGTETLPVTDLDKPQS